MGSARKGNAPDGSTGLVLTFYEGEEQDWRTVLREQGRSKPAEERPPQGDEA